MFISSEQLSNARANSKVFSYLFAAGLLAGAVVGPVVHFKSLPEAAQQVITPAYIINFNLSRIKTFSNRKWLETRTSAYKNAPEIAQKLDQFPVSIAVGAAAGSLALPLGLAGLLAVIRGGRKPKNKTPNRSALSDFLGKR